MQKMHGWKIERAELERNINHGASEDQEVLLWCWQWCQDRNISFEDFCRQVGVSDNTVYKVFTGRYVAQGSSNPLPLPEKLIKGAREFRRLEEERSLYGESSFVETATARKIWNALDLARESRTPVFLSGASHIGKTTACAEYMRKRRDSRTVYVRLRPSSGVKAVVNLIAAQFGLDTSHTKEQLLDEIVGRLTPNTIMIFDEVHLLTHTYTKVNYFNCVETLRYLYDEAQCGMVFIFTNLGVEKFQQHRNGELEQLFRRGVHRTQLGVMPSHWDVKALLKSQGLELPDRGETVEIRIKDQSWTRSPREVVNSLARHDGLKAITERMRYGTKLSKRNGGKLTWTHFLNAHLIIESNSNPEKEWT